MKSEYLKINTSVKNDVEQDDYIHGDDLQGDGREGLILVFSIDMECICNIEILPD